MTTINRNHQAHSGKQSSMPANLLKLVN